MRKHIAIIIASLALFTGQAHAQRCLPKMQGIELRANLVDGMRLSGNNGGYSFGAALSTYTKNGNKWVFGGEYLLKNNPYKDTAIPVAQFTAEGGYYFKILSDARKIVFVYAGASVNVAPLNMCAISSTRSSSVRRRIWLLVSVSLSFLYTL